MKEGSTNQNTTPNIKLKNKIALAVFLVFSIGAIIMLLSYPADKHSNSILNNQGNEKVQTGGNIDDLMTHLESLKKEANIALSLIHI